MTSNPTGFCGNSFVLMNNHVHLVVQTPDANLSPAMQWLKVSYSMWFNTKYNRVGPLFQGRFKSVLVDADDDWLLELSLYVHLNPVRTQAFGAAKHQKAAEAKGIACPSTTMVSDRIDAVQNYRWSSLKYYIVPVTVPAWLDLTEIMRRLSREKPLEHYRELLIQRICNKFDERFLEKLDSRLAVGDEGFVEEVRKLANGGCRDIDCKKELRRRVSWERLICLTEEVRGEPWAVIRHRRGDIGKAVVFRLARRFCGMTLREIGEKNGGIDYAAVSDLIRRYEKRGKPDPLEEEITKKFNLET